MGSPSSPSAVTTANSTSAADSTPSLKALYKEFLTRDELNLISLVNQGLILHDGKEVYISASLPATWQSRTALLFIQLAYQNLRRLFREIDRLDRWPPLSTNPRITPRNDSFHQKSKINNLKSESSFPRKTHIK